MYATELTTFVKCNFVELDLLYMHVFGTRAS